MKEKCKSFSFLGKVLSDHGELLKVGLITVVQNQNMQNWKIGVMEHIRDLSVILNELTVFNIEIPEVGI